jgi:tripartite-type tricarboxylate transporter receptor subunit TctC
MNASIVFQVLPVRADSVCFSFSKLGKLGKLAELGRWCHSLARRLAWKWLPVGAAMAALVLGLAPLRAVAQPYPTKSVKLIVPFPPGGAVDILGRAIAARLTEQLGQPFIVENRAGAGGSLGAEAAARATPDGYTLLMASTTTLSINQYLYAKLPYDPLRDFVPVTQVAFVPHLLVADPALPVRSLREFMAYAKANPGKLNYASAGNGTPHHIAAEMFKQMTGIEMVHVPYKGTAPAVSDLVGGQVAFMSVEILAAMPMVTAGKLQALGVATPRRNPMAPEVPTVAEAGLAGFEVTSWYGIVAPSGTPKEVTARLAGEVAKVVASADFRERLSVMGATPVGSSPEEFGQFIRRESAKWEKAVRTSGAHLD